MAAYQDLEKELEKLSIGTTGDELQVQNHAANLKASSSIPTFTNHKIIGSFQINEDKSFKSTNIKHAKLNPRSTFHALNGTDLATGYKTAKLCDNYQKYHELKQDYFFKWLIESNYFTPKAKATATNTETFKKPDFICFGGRITDPMMSPVVGKFGDWEIYAVKCHGSIYLFDVKRSDGGHNLQSYYGVYFEHLLTKPNPRASVPNEFDKTFVITETTFGSHQLLVMNEIDAEDEQDELVEIKVYFKKPSTPLHVMKDKFLKYWAQSVVPGVKQLVVGTHNSGIVQGVKCMSLDEVSQGLNVHKCLDFEDRFLSWIKNCFKEVKDNGNDKDDYAFKKFTWKTGERSVRFVDVPKEQVPKNMLPDWFVQEMKTFT